MDKKYFVLYLLPPRPDFAQSMTDEERGNYDETCRVLDRNHEPGKVLAFGPVLDPKEVYGLGIISVDSEQEVKDFIANDPAATINKYEYFQMKAVVPAK